MARISDAAPLSISMSCSKVSEAWGFRHPPRSRPPDLAGVSGLEHSLLAPAAACRRRFRRRAAACLLDADLHGAPRVYRAVFPDFSARRAVRQADGGQRFGRRDRQVHDRATWAAAAVLTVVLAGALVTYGGVSLFVAFFVRPDGAGTVSRRRIPNRLIPATVALGTSTFTMSALPGTPAIQNAIPMPFFGTTPLAAPGLGIIASAIMLGFGLWWLARAAAARRKGEGYGEALAASDRAAEDETVRQRARTACEFDPLRSIAASGRAGPADRLAAFPLLVVVASMF